ncbi:MAG: hypothetical protein ACYTG6_01975 [Planctomycetota bacterium]|jgi:acetyl esterase/lipase
MARTRLLVVTTLLTLAGSGAARADRLVPRSGRPVDGVLVSRSETEIVFNPYWSRNPEMVYEVIRLPASRVRRVEEAPHPRVEVFRRLAARTEGDTAALLAIGAYAADQKLRAHARMCYALAVAEDPGNEDAIKALGGRSKWEAVRRGNLHLDPAIREALQTYIGTEDPDARTRLARDLAALGFEARPEALERYRRSASAPTGYFPERPLSWQSDEYEGATYALFVPEGYDPVLPWPLIIGLHGGGADGRAGDEVVGSGRSAMNFYRDLAARHGYIVVCPDALEAPWGTPRNEGMVRALLQEVKLTYNIDVDRVYMTGHSMGGFGTWALGPRMAEELAAISPMAGGGGGGISDLEKTRTPIFIYHSDDDYVSVESDRAAARQLRDTQLDFVYTELPGKGHGFPESIRLELFAFFGPRRRFDPRYKDVWPRSSFAGKVTKDEERYLGDPLADLEGASDALRDLIAQLRLGGGRAAAAVERLATLKPEGAAKAVARVLGDPRVPFDARAQAARALGRLEDASAVKSLRKALVAEPSQMQAAVATEAARALERLQDAEAGRAFERAVEAWTAFYESKLMGDGMRFSDWERIVPTLASIVASWAATPVQGDASDLDRTVVRRLLAAGHLVSTSERVPQDPSVARAALAGAVATAYAAWGADDDAWERLQDAVKDDDRARRAVAARR